MMMIVVLAGALGWFAIVIGAAWQRQWLFGSIAGLAYVTALLPGAQRLGSPHPMPYGLLFGITLFLSAGLAVIGTIELATKLVADRRDGRS